MSVIDSDFMVVGIVAVCAKSESFIVVKLKTTKVTAVDKIFLIGKFSRIEVEQTSWVWPHPRK
jgi:hypothetical protein